MKHLYCAECGKELYHTLKAIKAQQRIVALVEPHECEKEPLDPGQPNPFEPIDKGKRKTQKSIDDMFSEFGFINKLKNLEKGFEVEQVSGDRRIPEHTKEVSSTAPSSVLDMVKGTIPSSGASGGEEEGE